MMQKMKHCVNVVKHMLYNIQEKIPKFMSPLNYSLG